MNKIRHHKKCPFCDSFDLDLLKVIPLSKDRFASCLQVKDLEEKYNYWFNCRKCDLRFSSIKLDKNSQNQLYKNYRTLYNSCSSPKDYFERLDSLPEKDSENMVKIKILNESLRNKGSNLKYLNNILDCGCGAGNMLYKLKTIYPNLNCYGFEPTADFAKFAATILGNNIENRYIEDYNSKKQFDLITLFHVFEHLLSPIAALNKLISLLSKSGYIYIVVPSILDFKLKDNFHERFMIQHTYYYSERFMLNLVRDSKIELLETKENISIRGKTDTHFLFKILI